MRFFGSSICLRAAVAMFLSGPWLHLQAAVRPSDTMLEVARELDRRGVELCVVRLPVRYELYESEETPWDQPLQEAHPNTIAADREAYRLMLQGIRVVDLNDRVRADASKRDIFREDRFHFTSDYDHELSGALMKTMWTQGLMLREGKPRDIVFFGDCFAESLGENLATRNTFDRVTSLVKYGGGGVAHNHLFAFGGEYLHTADLAVWVLTDRMFSDPGFAELELDALDPGLEPEVLQARIVQITPVDSGQVAGMPYPNATRATLFERLDTGERFVGVNYVARDRKLLRSSAFEPGTIVKLSLVPLRDFQSRNPAIASEYLLDNINALELPHYWLAGWMNLESPQVVEIEMQET